MSEGGINDQTADRFRTLSVIVPVFNERSTVAEIVRRMRSVDLPVEREIVVVDDGSDDGTGDVLTQLRDSTVRVLRHPQNRGKGAAIRTGLESRDRRSRARSGRRPRVRPRRLAAIARARPQGSRTRCLRVAVHRRASQHAVPALGGQPVPVARHQRALQQHAVRHGDLLQAVRPPGARRRSTPGRPLRLRARVHGEGAPPRHPHLRGADLVRRARARAKARRSPGRTASPPCGRS